ncbi:MAG: S8 family peptidase [Variovorax sp.]|nr:S8 family peptidase [Variovorax sp.]
MTVSKKAPRKPRQAQAASASQAPENSDMLRLIGRGVVPPLLNDPDRRVDMGLPADEDELGRYMVELNILYRGGLRAAADAFRALWDGMLSGDEKVKRRPIEISKSYMQLRISVKEWRELLRQDETNSKGDSSLRVIYKLWPDFKVKAQMDRSVATVKADAAYRSYSATGSGITWAVIDSGIDGTHPHFGSSLTKEQRLKSALHHPNVEELHYDFTPDDAVGPGFAGETAEARRASAANALVDGLGHGTHVAGIIAGGLPKEATDFSTSTTTDGLRFGAFEQVFEANIEGERVWSDKRPVQRYVPDPEALHGVAPKCLLVSLKVLDADGNGRVSDIMRALVYVREQLNDDPKMLRIHGVNLSVGYDFDAQMFACGQSPLCVEVDRLVRSGVVVVTAAGNTGYGSINAAERQAKVGLSNTINDPGNASLAITVGSTHRDAPHTYGVSFFSSKGPTGDGRLKPDLVAPGERITSCASKAKCEKLGIKVDDGVAAYVDDSGTSMAAPHVSGAIAAFLSIRREFIQRPEEVKRIFLDSATSLGRERYFEGHGLVDLMRAIQSV